MRETWGGRYIDDFDRFDSDLSITGWQLMFLRSAKNTGFEVREEPINQAVSYVRRCFLKESSTFTCKLAKGRNQITRGMAGAGILALAHAGLHNTPEAQLAGDWILKSGFANYNEKGLITGDVPSDDRYHYGLLSCSYAMYQLGGKHWEEFFPPMVKVLLSGQNADGSWSAENHKWDRAFGKHYTTAISVLALSSANQLMPIFQR